MASRKKKHERSKRQRERADRRRVRRKKLQSRDPDGVLCIQGGPGPGGGFGGDVVGMRFKTSDGQLCEVTEVRGHEADYVVIDELADWDKEIVLNMGPVTKLKKKQWEPKNVGEDMVQKREGELARLGYDEIHGFRDDARQLREAGLTVAYLHGRVFVHKRDRKAFDALRAILIDDRSSFRVGGVVSGRMSTGPNYANMRGHAKSMAFAQQYGASVRQLMAAMQMPRSALLGVASSAANAKAAADNFARRLADYNKKDVQITKQFFDAFGGSDDRGSDDGRSDEGGDETEGSPDRSD